jgi:hypothetical protein
MRSVLVFSYILNKQGFPQDFSSWESFFPSLEKSFPTFKMLQMLGAPFKKSPQEGEK